MKYLLGRGDGDLGIGLQTPNAGSRQQTSRASAGFTGHPIEDINLKALDRLSLISPSLKLSTTPLPEILVRVTFEDASYCPLFAPLRA
jgi:hypothetical protein